MVHTTARDEWKSYEPSTGRVTLLDKSGANNIGGAVVDFTQNGTCTAGYVADGAPCVYQSNPFSGDTYGYAAAGTPGVFSDFTSTGLDSSYGSLCCGTAVTDMGSCPVQHGQFSDLPATLTQVTVMQALNVPGKFFVRVANASGMGYSAPVTYELKDGESSVSHSFEYPPGTAYALKVDFGGSGASAKFPDPSGLTLGKVSSRGAVYTVGNAVTFADFSQSGLPVAAGMALCCAGGAAPKSTQYSVRFVPDGVDIGDESKHLILCGAVAGASVESLRFVDTSLNYNVESGTCTPMVVTVEGSGYNGLGPGFALRDVDSGLYLDSHTGVPKHTSATDPAALVYYNSAYHMWPVNSDSNISVVTGTFGSLNTLRWTVWDPSVHTGASSYPRVYLKEISPSSVAGPRLGEKVNSELFSLRSGGSQSGVLFSLAAVVVMIIVYLVWKKR